MVITDVYCIYTNKNDAFLRFWSTRTDILYDLNGDRLLQRHHLLRLGPVRWSWRLDLQRMSAFFNKYGGSLRNGVVLLIIKYSIAEQRMEPLSQLFYGQRTIVLGGRLFDVTYTDGATTLKFLHFMTHTQATLLRTLNV